MWCTARKPKGSSYTRSLTKLFEHSYRSINNIKFVIKITKTFKIEQLIKTDKIKKYFGAKT